MSEVQTVPNEARENVTHEEGAAPEFEPLFEDEGGFSEEEAQESGEESTPEPKDDAGTPDPEAKEEAPKDEPEAPKEEAEKKPPEGYVEIQALHAERKARQNLQRDMENLKAEIYALRSQPKEAPKTEDPWQDFKILTEEDFNKLREEDPDEAIAYMRKEVQFKEHKQHKEAERIAAERARYQEEQILERSWNKIAEVIPNVFDRENPEVQQTVKALNEFAEAQGFSSDEIAVLSNPSTRVIVKDRNGTERVAMMADAAATFVKMLNGYSKVNGATLTKEKEEAIRAEEREKVKAEITARIKKGELDFRSLGDAPGSSEKPAPNDDREYTEDEWAKLSPEKRRQLLGG